MSSYIQKVLFGIPGSGKSYKVDKEILPSLGIEDGKDDYVKTVFHPEYTYGDFMGKLLPITQGEKVTYNYYPGHFLQALAKAFKNILENPKQPANVVLVIDEINRGNSSAIFGAVFQLLDRDENGWSSYETNLSMMEYTKLLELIGIKYENKQYEIDKKLKIDANTNRTSFFQIRPDEIAEFTEKFLSPLRLTNLQVRIPPNLSIVATMNTSDNSIFYIDSAFKRRWDWEFVQGSKQDAIMEKTNIKWSDFVDKLNSFFKKNSDFIRNIEDKQIGYWFIKGKSGVISKEQIQNKLMFFIWDSVFSRNKEPLASLLSIDKAQMVTFGDFAGKVDNFIQAIQKS
jgi:5-methylcytosine-specific restriction enzyme B